MPEPRAEGRQGARNDRLLRGHATNISTNNTNLNISVSSTSGGSQGSKNPTPNISPTNINNSNQIVQNQSLGKYANGNAPNSNAEAQLNLFNKINLNGKNLKNNK